MLHTPPTTVSAEQISVDLDSVTINKEEGQFEYPTTSDSSDSSRSTPRIFRHESNERLDKYKEAVKAQSRASSGSIDASKTIHVNVKARPTPTTASVSPASNVYPSPSLHRVEGRHCKAKCTVTPEPQAPFERAGGAIRSGSSVDMHSLPSPPEDESPFHFRASNRKPDALQPQSPPFRIGRRFTPKKVHSTDDRKVLSLTPDSPTAVQLRGPAVTLTPAFHSEEESDQSEHSYGELKSSLASWLATSSSRPLAQLPSLSVGSKKGQVDGELSPRKRHRQVSSRVSSNTSNYQHHAQPKRYKVGKPSSPASISAASDCSKGEKKSDYSPFHPESFTYSPRMIRYLRQKYGSLSPADSFDAAIDELISMEDEKENLAIDAAQKARSKAPSPRPEPVALSEIVNESGRAGDARDRVVEVELVRREKVAQPQKRVSSRYRAFFEGRETKLDCERLMAKL